MKQTGYLVCQHLLALYIEQREQHSYKDQHFHSLPFQNSADFALFNKQGDDAIVLFLDTGRGRPQRHIPSNGPQTCTLEITYNTWSHSGLPKITVHCVVFCRTRSQEAAAGEPSSAGKQLLQFCLQI